MTVLDLIRKIKPAPKARGEGIRNARAKRTTTASLYLDVLLVEMEQGICREIEQDRLEQFEEEQRERIQESF